jgi:hypothetical protein
VSKGSGAAVDVVNLDGENAEYWYRGGTRITCTTPVDEFTVNFFLPNA